MSGTTVQLSVLDAAYTRLAAGRDAIIVEGAGGLLVPITREVSFATLFRRWDLTLMIVAANRLGMINHTLLTLRVARSLGIEVGGIIVNHLPVDSPDASTDSNLDVLRELVPEVPLIAFPRIEDPYDLTALADAVESSGLAVLLGPRMQSTSALRQAMTEANPITMSS
jgi:dethiobiotin synthetase